MPVTCIMWTHKENHLSLLFNTSLATVIVICHILRAHSTFFPCDVTNIIMSFNKNIILNIAIENCITFFQDKADNFFLKYHFDNPITFNIACEIYNNTVSIIIMLLKLIYRETY